MDRRISTLERLVALRDTGLLQVRRATAGMIFGTENKELLIHGLGFYR